MSGKAKLIIDEREINVLWFTFSFNQKADINGRPFQKPIFVGLQLTIETRKDLNLADWSFAPNQKKQLELHIYPVILGGKTRKIHFYDCHLVNWKNTFSANGSQPMSETLHITSAGIEDSNSATEYSAHWRKTFAESNVAPTIIEKPTPTITNINWIDPETKEILEETRYTESIALTAQIENQESDSATIAITKEDGTEFEKGKTELSFEESITEDGNIELTALEIKEKWSDFKTADIDKLIAQVTHGSASKKSKPLQIVPPPKVLVNFRTGNGYKGEYGFDWLRMADTGKKGDVFYKDIIGNYTTGSFVQNDAEYVKLGKKFEMPQHPIKANDKYVVPVLTLLPNKKATLTLKVEIEDANAKKIEYKYDNNYFKLDKTEVSHKTIGKKELADNLTIECIKEFASDQFIEVEADGKFAGKLKVLANDKAHRYKADVLFVNVWTDIISSGTPNKPALSNRDDELKKYMAQALAKPSFDTVALDLSSDATFNTNFSSAGSISNGSSDAIQDHMNTALYAKYDPLGKDYRKHYKIYFINESAGGLYGRSYGIPSTNRSVAVYSVGFNDSTLAHETFHAMGLYHSFSDSGAFTFEKNKTDNIMDYSDIATPPVPVISTWQWQWTELWKNLDKE